MKPKSTILIILIVILTISPNCYIKNVEANPLSIDELNAGTTLTLAENTSMPIADVNISISADKQTSSPGVAPTFDYEISLDSEFIIESTSNQNCSIGFAYPDSWGFQSGSDVEYPEFSILFEGVSIPYVDFDGSEFDTETLPTIVVENLNFLTHVRLAIINVTLEANTTYVLNVHCQMEFPYTQNILRFSYCVGSAKAWTGSTQETIRIEVLNQEVFNSVTFYPQESVSVQSDTDRITGNWTLNIPNFEEDYVSCDIWQSQWPYGAPTPNDTFLTMMLLGGTILLTIIASIAVGLTIKRKFS